MLNRQTFDILVHSLTDDSCDNHSRYPARLWAARKLNTLFDALAATTVGAPTTDLAIQAEQCSGSVDPLFSDTGRRWSDTG